jgi:hypothetical protein
LLPANVKYAVIPNLKITGYNGPLLSVENVAGSGLAGAAKIDLAKMPVPIAAPPTPYQLFY